MNNKYITHVFFDLDGTLLNTKDGIVRSVSHALASVGIVIEDYDLLERHIGPPLKRGFMEFYSLDHETADKVVSEYRSSYKVIGKEKTFPYEGIEGCLQSLREMGYHLMVATSKPEPVAKEFLKNFGLASYFDEIYGSMLDESRMSKEEVLLHIFKEHPQIKKEHAIMIGDRCYDVIGAIGVGIPCVGVSYGFGSREELLNAGAVEVVDTTHKIVDYFRKNSYTQ